MTLQSRLFVPVNQREPVTMPRSLAGSSTTVETLRSWITCCWTFCRAKAGRRSGTTTATAMYRGLSSTPAPGLRLRSTPGYGMALTRTTSERTSRSGSSLSDQRTRARLQDGRTAGGED